MYFLVLHMFQALVLDLPSMYLNFGFHNIIKKSPVSTFCLKEPELVSVTNVKIIFSMCAEIYRHMLQFCFGPIF